MAILQWDKQGERFFETGVDRGVLYPVTALGAYGTGVPWNGITAVTESPSGADLTDFWADNIKYASIRAAEDFGATIEAYTYPAEFAECDGVSYLVPGVAIGQQPRKRFGFIYRTHINNDVGLDRESAYKIHIIYNASAAPSEKAYGTINDSPEAITFSWEIEATAVTVDGFKPVANIVIDSTKVHPTKLAGLLDILYGSESTSARLPSPTEVLTLLQFDIGELLTAALPSPQTDVYDLDETAISGGIDFHTYSEGIFTMAIITIDRPWSAVAPNKWVYVQTDSLVGGNAVFGTPLEGTYPLVSGETFNTGGKLYVRLFYVDTDNKPLAVCTFRTE